MGIASGRDRALAALGLVAAAVIACAVPPTPAPPLSSPSAPTVLVVPTAPIVEPTPVPMPSASVDVIVSPDFVPPTPLCPAPRGQVDAPGVQVRIADGEPIAATMGSYGLLTCGTSGEYDVGDLAYSAPLVAQADETLVFAVDPGWQVLWFEAFDHPKRGDGAGMTPGVRVAGGPAEVTIPVPGRTGDMIVGMDMWVTRDDGKVITRIEPSVWVRPAGQ